MADGTKLKIEPASFDTAASGLQAVIDALDLQLKAYENARNMLLKDWKGGAKTKAAERTKTVKKQLTRLLKNVQILKDDLIKAKAVFVATDQSMSDAVVSGE